MLIQILTVNQTINFFYQTTELYDSISIELGNIPCFSGHYL